MYNFDQSKGVDLNYFENNLVKIITSENSEEFNQIL